MLLGMWLACSPARPQTRAGPQDSSQFAQLLSNAKNLAALIRGDIATLDFVAQLAAEGGRDTMFNLFTQRATELHDQAQKLEEMQKRGSRGQQTAAERMIPVMKELASSAEAAVNMTKTNQNRPVTGDFRNYLKLNADLAEELSSMIGAAADYAKTRDELDRIADRVREK